MLEKLEKIVEKYEELTKKVGDPEIIADNRTWQKLVKEHSELTPIVEAYNSLKKCLNDLADAEEMLNTEKDKEMIELLEQEIEDNKAKKRKN